MLSMRALALHVATIVALYFGYVEKVEGAENTGLFLVWFYFVIALAYVSRFEKVAPQRPETYSYQWLMWPCRFAVLGMLVWYGHWVVGTAYAIAIVIAGAMYAHSVEHWKDVA